MSNSLSLEFEGLLIEMTLEIEVGVRVNLSTLYFVGYIETILREGR